MSAKTPWMPLYVADYLADTRRLTTLEHGAYLLLIMEYWRNGGLPCDDEKLARIAGLSHDEWKSVRTNISDLFLEDWKHKRIELELSKTKGKSESARNSSAKRWESERNAKAMRTHTDRSANGYANGMLSESESEKKEILRDPASVPTAAPREFDLIESHCRRALGEAAPLDPVIGPIVALIRQGVPIKSICDVLASEARRKRDKPIRTWGIWAKIVVERLEASPKIAPGAAAAAAEKTVDLPAVGVIPEKNARAAIENPEIYRDWTQQFFGGRGGFRAAIASRAPHLLEFWPPDKPAAAQAATA